MSDTQSNLPGDPTDEAIPVADRDRDSETGWSGPYRIVKHRTGLARSSPKEEAVEVIPWIIFYQVTAHNDANEFLPGS